MKLRISIKMGNAAKINILVHPNLHGVSSNRILIRPREQRYRSRTKIMAETKIERFTEEK